MTGPVRTRTQRPPPQPGVARKPATQGARRGRTPQSGSRAADPDWTPKVFSGSAPELIRAFLGFLLPSARPDDYIIVVSTGRQLHVYRGTRFLRTFQLLEAAAPLPPGVFELDTIDGKNVVLQLGYKRDGHIDYRALTADPEHPHYNNMAPRDLADYDALIRSGQKFIILRSGSRGGGTGDGGGGDKDASQKTGDGDGAGGGDAPRIPPWAVLQFRVVNDRVQLEKRRIAALAAKNADEHDDAAVDGLLVLAAVPARVGLATDTSDRPLLAVSTAKGQGGLPLTEGQPTALLWERVQALTRVLNAGLKPTRTATPQDIMVGLPSDSPANPDHVPANKEGYPAEIINLGPAVGIAGSTHAFQMNLDWSIEGQWGTLAAFGPRAYTWDVFELRNTAGSVNATPSSRRVKPSEAAKTHLKEGISDIGEDAEASVNEEIIDPATGTAIAVDAVVRGAGTLISSFVTLASTPSNERGVTWRGAGTYVVRCLSSRPPLSRQDAPANAVVRAPSIAFYTIRVVSPEDMAATLTAAPGVGAAQADLDKLTKSLNDADPKDRAGIEEQIAAKRDEIDQLRRADERDTASHLDSLDAQSDQQIALAQMVAELRNTGAPPEQWKPLIAEHTPALLRPPTMDPDTLYGQVVALHVELTLGGRQPATVIDELRRASDQTRQQRGALLEASGDMQGPQFRPHMSFVPRSDGRALPLMIVLGEAKDSTDGDRTWLLFDLSTPGHRDRYSGHSSTRGAAGHAAAIRAAVNAFVGDIPYGRGTLGIRFSEALTSYVGEIGIGPTITATPNAAKRWEQRLESLATAAATAALFVTGPVGMALGIVGGVAGGVTAAIRMHHRYEGGYLQLDLATVMDITAVVGAAAIGVGAWAGAVRGAATTGTSLKWVNIAGRVERGVHLFGYLQLGSQIFVIPISLAEQLAAIDKNTSLSPGERAAQRAMAFLGALNNGLQSIGTAHQMLGEHIQVTDAPPPDLNALKAIEAAPPVAEPASRGAPGERSETATPTRESTGRTPESAPSERVAPPEHGSDARPAARGVEVLEPGSRTAAGTAGGEPPNRQGGSASDINPTAKAKAVELLEARVGRNRPPQRPTGALTEAELASRPTSAETAVALYDRAVAHSAGNEVGLFYNPRTGEFAVMLGSEMSVGAPGGEGWQALIHLHPNPENVIVHRMPAPRDVEEAVLSLGGSDRHVEYVEFQRPDGTTGVSRLEITRNPPKIVVELPAEPSSGGKPGEAGRRIEATSSLDYARQYGQEATHLAPGSKLYKWIISDLDAFYARFRAERPVGPRGERTAVGTAEPPAPAPAGPGAEPPTAGAFREELGGRRPDVAARFAEADAAFEHSENPEGSQPLGATFDAALATLEAHGMGPEGYAAVERQLRPSGDEGISAGRLRRTVEAVQRLADIVTLRPELLTETGQVRYRAEVRDIAQKVDSAYRNGRTLEGTRLSTPRSPELAEAMTGMHRAIDGEATSPTRDNVARLMELMAMRDQVARAAEVLRSYGPKFTASEHVAPGRTPAQESLILGVGERAFTVDASGTLGEPLARDLPGLGLEEYMLAPRKLADLPTRTRGLGGRLAELLRGWHRAHLIGPGFGTELFTGMMLAPEEVNLHAQNEGVEAFIRAAAADPNFSDVSVRATAHGRRLEVPLTKGRAEHVDILRRVDYTIDITVKGHEGQEAVRTHRVVIDVGDPPSGAIRVYSDLPAGVPGADVLASFPPLPAAELDR